MDINNKVKSASEFYNRQVEYATLSFDKGNLLPRRYVLILTNLCNLRCSFCFQERKKRSDRMLTDDWLNFINQIPDKSRITLTGGEPFVFKDFDKIFREANKNSETNLVSNGILLDQKLNILLKEKNFKVLGISIDEIGNKNRGFTSNQWDNLVLSVNDFVKQRDKKKLDTVVEIKTVILEENINELFNLHKFVIEKMLCDTHSFQLLKGADIQHSDIMFDFNQIDLESNAYQYQNFEELVNQLNLIKEYNYKNNTKSFLHPNVISLNDENKLKKENLIFLNNRSHDQKNFKTCHSPWSSVHVNVDGNLFPCMAVSMGNVKNEKLEDIIFSEKFMSFKNLIKKNKTLNGCNRCGWLKKDKDLSF